MFRMASIVTLIFLLRSSIDAQQPQDLATGLALTLNEIETWTGSVSIQHTSASEVKNIKVSNFAWDRKDQSTYVRMHIPVIISALDSDKTVAGTLDQETIVHPGEMIQFEHNIPKGNVNGFEKLLAGRKPPFRVGQRSAFDSESLGNRISKANFWPGFMFQGTAVFLLDNLEGLLSMEESELSTLQIEDLGDGVIELREKDAAEDATRYRFSSFRDRWLPVEILSGEVNRLSWDWNDHNGLIRPLRLTIVDDAEGSPTTSIYEVKEDTVNGSILPSRFDHQNFDCDDGDLLADRIVDRLFIRRNGRFEDIEGKAIEWWYGPQFKVGAIMLIAASMTIVCCRKVLQNE